MEASDYIEAGAADEVEYKVRREHTASHVGSGSLEVLATPIMIAFVERVAHAMLEKRLPPGYSSVGVHVDMRHMAPSLENSIVRVSCQVEEVEAKRVKFSAQVWDVNDLAGEGSHQRAVIDVALFKQRLEGKGRDG